VDAKVLPVHEDFKDRYQEGFAPLQWYEDPKWGVVGYTIRPSTNARAYTPWVLLPDRVITEADYKEPFIYWNWPVFGYPHRPEILE
jgi:hypothetical protein